ncbi:MULTISPECIES: hypothetical protein [Bradyrhizobium]|jgi:hypothetical protein|uniref:Uncharacterized protein n=3 Tax=Bradyrhizobium TaxID=374 RepID=A0A810CTZ6_9BRAD|nr:MULTISPECIES: hypothetical protein [Bradyrhizobium]BCE22154.1 hypothetical protein XF1B_48350 [Bradyrhizobium diazoefficiens]MBP1297082.1 hypothetical protein [Bradyrhizobium elkanii]MCP1932155.1 hypothetical protein [Bradyrhizobium elkanii]MCS3577302.1 hypothetical protein [Bradyrhizobium elkanii]MCS3720179.1 hypothetical protein [Bradyrhizobium elkanii]
MPRRRRRQEEDLVHAAVEALEDEIRCWQQRERPYSGDMVTLTRWPLSRIAGPIGPAEVDAQAMQTIEHIDLQKNEVPFFLRYRGMEAAIKKIRELEA